MVKSKGPSRAFAVVGVFLLMSGLVLGLFDEARAVSIEFSDAPSVIAGIGSYDLNIIIPSGERVPIERVTAVIERQADGATTKEGATVLTRATCDFTGSKSACVNATLVVDGTVTTAITSIAFIGYYEAGTDNELNAAGSFGYGALLGTTTGYGYDELSGYGYGYDLGTRAGFNAGTGYGYGRTDGQDLSLRFRITVNANVLEERAHYLTILADTGSSIIGQLSSPYTKFSVLASTTPVTQTVTAAPVAPPAGAETAFRTHNVTSPAGGEIVINTAGSVPLIRFVTDGNITDAQIEVAVFNTTNAPADTGALPAGIRAAQYIRATISTGGENHTVQFTVSLPEGETDLSKAVLMKWNGTAWVSKGKITIGDDGLGTVSSSCCSNFVVAFDDEAPVITSVDVTRNGLFLTFTPQVTDNVAVDRVAFSINGVLNQTINTAPFAWTWNTTTYGATSHTIKVTAYDQVDNEVNTTLVRSPPSTGGGGGGGGGDDDTGSGGGSGGGGGPIPLPGSQTITGTAIDTPAGALAAFRASGIAAPADGEIIIVTGNSEVPRVRFVTTDALDGASIDVTVFDAANRPGGTGVLPDGARAAYYLRATISTGGDSHTIEFTVVIPQGEDASKAILLKWEGNQWAPKGRIVLGANGHTGASDCCSNFAVAIDEEDPFIDRIDVTEAFGSITYTAIVSDNIAVDRVEFYLEGILMETVRGEPYTWTWDTTGYTEAQYKITAVAYDLVDNQHEKETIRSQTAVDPVDPSSPWATIGIVSLIVIGLAFIVVGGWFYYRKREQQ